MPNATAALRAESLPTSSIDESLGWRHYVVCVAEGELADALDRASPIRQDGNVYHGYADWHVDWHFSWEYDAHGRCIIGQRSVHLRSRITLPRLVDGNAAQRAEFERYLDCLTEHELGHIEVARRAAAEIDRHLASLPPNVNDHRFATLGNRGAQTILARYRALEKQYDRDTGHGRTQGARLAS